MDIWKSNVMGISASTLHAVLAPGAHRDVSDLVHESLLRCWLAWAARNSGTYCEILRLHLDLRISRCIAYRALADYLLYYHILRLPVTSFMRVVQWS